MSSVSMCVCVVVCGEGAPAPAQVHGDAARLTRMRMYVHDALVRLRSLCVYVSVFMRASPCQSSRCARRPRDGQSAQVADN